MATGVADGRVDCLECKRHMLYPEGTCWCMAEADEHESTCATHEWNHRERLSDPAASLMSADECESFVRRETGEDNND